MGLFDFVSDIGKKLFHKEEEAPAALKEHVEKDNPGVNDLDVQVSDGVAKIKGTADSPEAMQKAVLMVGNVLGIKSVQADELTVNGEKSVEPPAESVTFYTIVSGDNLSKIAKHFYGDANKYPLIFEANREVIKDPDLIFPGQKIRIPNQDAN